MATLETQYKNWLKENEPITYSEWLEMFSEIHHLDKLKEPTMITDLLNEHGDPEITKKVEKEAELREAAKEFVLSYDFSKITNPNHLANRCFQYGAKWKQEQILQFIYSELTERRPYSSSKMCEVVIEFIEQLNDKK